MKDVTLRQLRFLSEAARTGSLAGAALSMHVTAPAVGQQLRLLEREVGLPLLERGRGGQEVTEAGALVLATARRIEAEIRACSDQLGALRRGESGHVALGAVSTAKYFAPAMIARFRQRYPDVRVVLSVNNREVIVRELERNEIDLAIMGTPPQRFETVAVPFADHPLVVIAPPSHPRARERAIPLEALAGERFLVREQGSGTRSSMERFFGERGFTPRIDSVMNSNETIKQAVMAGMGVAFISRHAIGLELATGHLCVLIATT